MAKYTFDIKNIDVPSLAQKPLYAGIGATDVAVTAVMEYVADVSKTVTGVQKSVTSFDPKKAADTAAKRAASRRAAVEKRVAELQGEALALPGKVQKSVQSAVNDNVATVTGTYSDLATRGEAVFKGTKKVSTASVEVKVNTTRPSQTKGTKKPAAKKAAEKTSSKATSAKKTATKKATTAKKSAAKKTTTARNTAAKKVAATPSSTSSTSSTSN